MNAIKAYLMSITTAAIICAVLKTVVGSQKSMQKIFYIISGVFMTVTMLKPLVDIRIDEIIFDLEGVSKEASFVAAEAYDQSVTEMKIIIGEQTKAYILEEAKSMGLKIEVMVQVSNENVPIPYSVSIRGNISPYNKKILSSFISTNLGITEEHQFWG